MPAHHRYSPNVLSKTLRRKGFWFPMLLGLVVLSGCASTLSSAIYGVVKDQNMQLHDVQIASPRAPYEITWTTKLGTAGHQKSYKAPLVVISSGQYHNWTWTVQGPSSVAASWKIWLQHGAQQSGITTADGQPATLDWQHGFERLWKVTNYLLGEKPLPMRLTLTLIPNKQAFQGSVTRSSDDKVPVVFSAWYPTTTKVTKPAAQKRFHYYAESLAIAGGMLERVELARGVTTAPAKGAGRTIKDRANAVCWRIAGRPAIAAGTTFKFKSQSGIGGGGVNLVANIYQQHPNDIRAQYFYAAALTLHAASNYLASQGLKMPASGKDFSSINALLGFCRAFIHYPGDIRNKPMPLRDVKPVHLFPLPTTGAGHVNQSESMGGKMRRHVGE